ncbi:PAS domain-containing protein [Methanococcoides orientis]|uniref:GAF domain-containing protein n=1 Tax=Methanococcoides orientis TaxID=2822137 RepID=UPI001E48365C|nr:GAF domain-containing protein [Methanococcoides orientis]UGV40815.1 PAS domain-containing protein [Methanococcoides orientis]
MKGIVNLPDIQDEMPEVAFVWRSEYGWPLESVSDNVSFFGYEPDDFLIGGLSYEDIIHPTDLEMVRKALENYSDSSVGDLVQEYRILKADGDIRWVREKTQIIYDMDGQMQYLTAKIVDINDEKQHDDFMFIQDELGSDLSWPVNLEDSMDVLLELTTQLDAIDICALYVVDEVTGGLVLVNHKGLSNDFVNSVSYFGADSGQVNFAQKGFPIYKHYSEVYPFITGPRMQDEGLQGTAIIPIHHEHRFVGLLIASSSSEFIIPEGDRDSLDVIKSLAGLMISNMTMSVMSDGMHYSTA